MANNKPGTHMMHNRRKMKILGTSKWSPFCSHSYDCMMSFGNAFSPHNNVSNTGLHRVAWFWLSNSSEKQSTKEFGLTPNNCVCHWWHLNPFSSRHCLSETFLQIRIVNNKGRLHLATRSSTKQKWMRRRLLDYEDKRNPSKLVRREASGEEFGCYLLDTPTTWTLMNWPKM